MKFNWNEFSVVFLWVVFIFMAPVASGQDEKRAEPKPSGKEEYRVYEATSRTRFNIGGVSVGAGYAEYSSPSFYGPYSYPGYAWDFAAYRWWPYSGFWSPLYYPGMLPGFAPSEGKGEIRLDSSEKEAEVYIDGAYAGIARDLKSIWLDAGAYDLELRGEGDKIFQKRIYILSGKTLKISAKLSRESQREAP